LTGCNAVFSHFILDLFKMTSCFSFRNIDGKKEISYASDSQLKAFAFNGAFYRTAADILYIM